MWCTALDLTLWFLSWWLPVDEEDTTVKLTACQLPPSEELTNKHGKPDKEHRTAYPQYPEAHGKDLRHPPELVPVRVTCLFEFHGTRSFALL
jgi:hypothetical protein